MSLADILKTLIKPTTRTSADLRADLAKIDIQVLEAKVDAIERQRRELLLRGSDAEVLAITQHLSAANLEAERGQAAVDELTRLISEAEQREAREAIEATASGARMRTLSSSASPPLRRRRPIARSPSARSARRACPTP